MAELSERQAEIAELAAAGATDREIARALGIRYETVRTQHMRQIRERLGVASRAELARVVERGSLR